MQNLVLHVVLPKGLALSNGAFLAQDTTVDVVSQLTPYYSSVDLVRLAGGLYLRKLSDLTIAAEIYNNSQQVDTMYKTAPTDPTAGPRFAISRQNWVTNQSAHDLILNVLSLVGHAGSHVLANFSVARQRGSDGEGLEAKLADLQRNSDRFEVAIRSLGQTTPGGRPKPGMAAKGVMDWSEKTPARQWTNTGMGANATALDFGSPTGGRGKPTKFFNQPYYSPPIIGFRTGIYQGAYPLVVTNPYPNTV